MLLFNFKASTNHWGNISTPFTIGRGCRQGDPIASYLFIICLEILAHKLRNNRELDGFKVGDLTHLLEIYADDMTIFLEAYSKSIKSVIKTLDDFYGLSGLKISVSKTKAIWFGKNYMCDYKLCPEIDLIWDKKFTLLGIDFHNNLEKMEDNFWNKMSSLEKLLANWSYRYLTTYGKITIIRSLALSKLSHIVLVIPYHSKRM